MPADGDQAQLSACTPAEMTRRALADVARAHGLGPVSTSLACESAQTHEEQADSLAEILTELGLPARPVELSLAELERLPLPTLCVLRSGAVLAVQARAGRRQLQIGMSDGSAALISRAAFEARSTGIALDLSGKAAARGRLATRLWDLLREQRANLWRVVGFGAAVMLLSTAMPILTRTILDRALPNYDLRLNEACVLALLVLGLHSSWLGWLRARVTLAFETQVETAIARGVFDHGLRLSWRDAQARDVGTALETLGCASVAARIAVTGLLEPSIDVVLGLWYLGLLASNAPRMAAVACAATALMVAISLWLGTRIARLQETRVGVAAGQRSLLHELLVGAPTLKALGAERRAIGLWRERFFEERMLAIREGAAQIGLRTASSSCQKAVSLTLFAWGGAACLRGELSLGQFLALAMFADGFVGSVAGACTKLVEVLSLPAKLRKSDELLACEPRRPSRRLAAFSSCEYAIELNDVWFRYAPDAPWIVRGEQLRVKRGETFVLSGASGQGKTTLLRLIAGLLQPERGCVRVLGRDPSRTAGLSAYLPQEPLLFSGSILANLRLLSGASTERILAAAQQTGLERLAAELPLGLETMLPSGGNGLSAGERQLVLLTAAVATSCPVLLLDESLAHIDRVGRAELTRRGLFTGKTIVTVVHDA
jgi:ATP-binding cassette subfamily B protein RaxB